MIYYLYEIIINDTRRYIGITNDLKRRQREHNRGLKNGDKKYLYHKLQDNDIQEVDLKLIEEFNNKSDAMRMEAYLIIEDWFSNRQLWQSPPIGFKYF